MSEARLVRTAFKTSRLLDFVGERELTAQIGHETADWARVIGKELADNGIDAAEEYGIAPSVEISVSSPITVPASRSRLSPRFPSSANGIATRTFSALPCMPRLGDT
jgi:hypothetical protein